MDSRDNRVHGAVREARNGPVTLRYRVLGTGPPLLLLHPGLGDGTLWQALGYTEPLGRRFRLIVPDLRGHGLSDIPRVEAAYTHDVMVGDLLAVLDAEGVERAPIVGFSLGGVLALHLAGAAPARVSTLVAGGAPGALPASTNLPATAERLERHGVADLAPALDGDPALLPLRTVMLAADAVGQAARYRALAAWPSVPPAAVTQPLFLYVGDRDRFHDAVCAFAAAVPQAQLRVIPGLGHLPLFAHPEGVLDDILVFLTRQHGASATGPSAV